MAKGDTKEVVLDFSGVKPFEPMDGDKTYLCAITGLKLGTAKSSGDPKASLELTIKAPDEVAVEEWVPDKKADGGMAYSTTLDKTTKASGRKLFREYSLKPEALPFLYELIKSADPSAELNESFKLNTEDYMGLEVACRIKNEAFNEQIRPRVQRILPASAYKG